MFFRIEFEPCLRRPLLQTKVGIAIGRANDHFIGEENWTNLNLFSIFIQPDVTSTETTAEDEFLVIACDGIWNSMSSQQCCDFIMERIGKMELKEITAEVKIQ